MAKGLATGFPTPSVIPALPPAVCYPLPLAGLQEMVNRSNDNSDNSDSSDIPDNSNNPDISDN